jgi:phosphoribosyl-ATP pyrophosphohydrolase/phosphoribosyl-AMP cyclohydrolase/histidinol dehydrogenase
MAAPITLRRVLPEDVKKMNLDPVDDATRAQAGSIVAEVRAGGEAALLSLAARFGDLAPGAPHVLRRPALEAAFLSLPGNERALLERVAGRIRAFAAAQRAAVADVATRVPGGTAGHTVTPCAVAGCYAPGGRYPLPSSVLMTAITARVAGVGTVWVASPRPAAVTLAAAWVAGADALLAVGGAQAIAALAYGAGEVPACDIIVGPGNRWVTAAKAIVAGSGACGIDMLAGPSECLVLADGGADPALVAADLLAQAEHDTDALPILVTTAGALVPAVEAALGAQLAALPTAGVAGVAVGKGFAVVCEGDMDAAIRVVDALAPEHLELQLADVDTVLPRLRNYGGLFIGAGTAEVFGDYGAGPNHVLPTSGTARFTGGLSVFTFLVSETRIPPPPPHTHTHTPNNTQFNAHPTPSSTAHSYVAARRRGTQRARGAAGGSGGLGAAGAP